MSNEFVKGQRWVSSMEPELGLGLVVKVSSGRVSIEFAAHEETRIYTWEHAPLKRVRFSQGDRIRDREGKVFLVHEVREDGDLLHYMNEEGTELSESELSDSLSFSNPQDRLLSGHIDHMDLFDLRYRTLQHRHKMFQSRVRGFQGARMELIPHQLYVAGEVSSRYAPRVLLADEVGLGKTIEACLILNRLLLSGRVQRALILGPEPLLHQWFVELLRRFHLTFSIFDEERCQSIEDEQTHQVDGDVVNPFLEEQLVLCATSFLVDRPNRGEQALQAGWDLLIVDEAHHLEWSAEEVSPAYLFVEKLAKEIRRLILLTATPEQLGREGHFARLRLLDPDRYTSLEAFLEQGSHYQDIARLADGLLGNSQLSQEQWEELKNLFAHYTEKERTSLFQGAEAGEEKSRQRLLGDLLDQYGTGRVMFRNRRASMEGFPGRKVDLVSLKPTTGNEHAEWLSEYLKSLNPTDKVLLIGATLERIERFAEDLRGLIGIKMAVFHEGMTLIQRDRNAAWFAEEDGAQILLCSEIGSEGRNFQFASRLVLLDLPLDPALLEQRIGRLDRIGQTDTIQIFVPFIQKSGEEMIARWYHEGLDAFETCQQSGHRYVVRFGETLSQLMKKADVSGRFEKKRFDTLIEETRAFHDETVIELENGRDHLLELNSFREEDATQIVNDIRAADDDPEMEKFFLDLLDHFGVTVEELRLRVYHLKPEHLYTDAFPGLPEEGLTVALDREMALKREEIQFMTWDHPMLTGAMDLLLGSEFGNCSFAYVDADGPKMVFLEAIYILECLAPTHLHADRFFPPTPIRVLVNHRGENLTNEISYSQLEDYLRPGKAQWVQKNAQVLQGLLPKLRDNAERIAQSSVAGIIKSNRSRMSQKLQTEIDRLHHLKSINNHIRDEELLLAEECQRGLDVAIKAARLRLDSLRILFKGED